jgi:hypothetical protein
MGKYFNVTIKPFIDPHEQNDGVIADAKILADWTEFEIPSGPARLIGMTILSRGTDGADVTDTDFEIIWAKGTKAGGAPVTLGNTTDSVQTPGAGDASWFNLIQGKTYVDVSNGMSDGDLVTLRTIHPLNVNHATNAAGAIDGFPAKGALVLQGEPNSGSSVGYDKLYCAMINKSGNFTSRQSTITVDGTPATTTNVMTVADVSALLVFAPGDVIYDEDDRLMGTVKSVDSATQITFEDNLANAGVDDKILYNASPITIVAMFEK